MTTDIQICDIEKNTRETVRLQLREYKGHRFVDLRIMTQNKTGDLVFTPKGFGIAPMLLDPLIAGLMAAKAEAAKQGLL